MEEMGKKRNFSSERVTMEDVARHCNVSTATVSRVLSGRSAEFSVSETMIQRVRSAAKQLNYSPDRKRPGKRVTMKDIARYCDVSKTTVSRVLSGRFKESSVSGELVQRVKEAAEHFNYRPNRMARAVSNQRTHLIGLSCFYTDAPNRASNNVAYEHQLLGEYVDTIVSHPGFKDYDLVFHTRKETTGRPLKPQDFQTDLLDGIVYNVPSDAHTEFLDVASQDFPVILLGQIAGAEEKVPCVDINNRKMAKQAVEHLIGLGRRNILMLIPERFQHLNCMHDRLQGYRDALTESRIQVSDDFIHIVSCLKSAVDTFLADLPRLGQIDAIFCTTDDLAALCIAPLQAMGRCIPEDIALIGFGNDSICERTTPPISSVSRSEEKKAHTAIDLLLKILNKEIPYEPGFHEIEADLVIRESTVAAL